MKKVKWIFVFVLGFLGWGVLMGWLLKIDFGYRSEMKSLGQYPDRGLPVISIELNGVSLEEIKAGSKETKYDGNGLKLYDGDNVLEFSGVEIKGRGNSTWGQPKAPYQIKFEKKINLLGLGKMKEWVLLANYFDVSLIRNDVAMLLAEMLGEKYNVRGEFAEVYFDDEYEGLYYLLPKVEIAKGSVDLRDPRGVLFEIDTLHGGDGHCYTSYLGECLVLKRVVNDAQEGEVSTTIRRFLEDFNVFESAVKDDDYDEVFELIDVESFAQYYLISEFTVNPDAYASSFYLYKDGDDDKIHAGPVWDFDFALANRNWSWQVDERFFSSQEMLIRKREAFGLEGLNEDSNISKLFYYLAEMPEFQEEIARVFQEKMSGRKIEFELDILGKVKDIRTAAIINNERWELDDFDVEVKELIKWVSERYEFFEDLYGGSRDLKFL